MDRARQKHIRTMITALWRYWEKHPHLRLGQLVSNMAYRHGGIYTGTVFYTPDENLLHNILNALEDPKEKSYEGTFWKELKSQVDWDDKSKGYLTKQMQLINAHSKKTGMGLEESVKAVGEHLRGS